MEFSYFLQRRNRLRRLLKKMKLPASILVTNETNVTYLTGFTGDSTALLITADTELLVSDSRFTIQLAEECDGIKATICPPGTARPQFLYDTINKHRLASLAVEADHLTCSRFDQIDAGCHLLRHNLIDRIANDVGRVVRVFALLLREDDVGDGGGTRQATDVRRENPV